MALCSAVGDLARFKRFDELREIARILRIEHRPGTTIRFWNSNNWDFNNLTPVFHALATLRIYTHTDVMNALTAGASQVVTDVASLSSCSALDGGNMQRTLSSTVSCCRVQAHLLMMPVLLRPSACR